MMIELEIRCENVSDVVILEAQPNKDEGTPHL